MTPNPRLSTFVGGTSGPWSTMEIRSIVGEALPAVQRLNIVASDISTGPVHAGWILRGVTSDERYVNEAEKAQLVAVQPALGRAEADRAVLIPIRKNASWWILTHQERRRIFEERSHHTQIGLEYLPAIARRLYHSRDLTKSEPFDFLTWFEFAENDTARFDELLRRLRLSEEWTYVEREIEIRLQRVS